jgi:hypothetical protein
MDVKACELRPISILASAEKIGLIAKSGAPKSIALFTSTVSAGLSTVPVFKEGLKYMFF